MDLRKEIKLRDLVRRERKAPAPARTTKEATARRERPALRVPRLRSGGGRGTQRLVGLKVGASKIAAACVENNGAAELVRVAQQPLEPGIVVGGELREPGALAQALGDLFERHDLPRRGVRLGIGTNRIGVRAFDLEGVDDPTKFANAVRFRAHEALPIPIDQAVLDYHVIAERVDEAGGVVRTVLLVVAYRDLVDRYVAACREARLELMGIDLEAFALLRALTPPVREPDAEPAALVAVSIGHDRSTLAVSDGRVCEFTRVLEWGGGAINVAIARALDIAPSEAEPIKHTVVLGHSAAPDGLSDERAAAVREAVQREVQSFAREIVSSLQYYQSQPGSLGIREVAVTGGTAHLQGLPEQLQALIGVGVRVGDPLARVSLGKDVSIVEPIGSLAVAIGLGIED